MNLKTVILSSFVALSLVACGSGDDNAKPDDPKNNLPPRPKDCVAAGDNCKWDGNSWVIGKPGGEGDGKGDKDGKDVKDEAPVADGTFDYSDIGVTDKLEPEKRGFGFYHKGPMSPLDAKLFKNGVTQSPNIPWSSTLDYDPDLYNFVAIRLGDNNKENKHPVKFMFDKIGEVNQELNKNVEFFGNGGHDTTHGAIGESSINSVGSDVKFAWNVIPAVVNTYMYRNNEGVLEYEWGDEDRKFFKNQEEEAKSSIGSGAVKLRVYGRNAFLEKDGAATQKANYLDPSTWKPANTKTIDYKLDTRKTPVANQVNFVWYDLSNFSSRKKKATFETDSSGKVVTYSLALEKYADDKANYKDRPRFPTDVEFGALENVQFGRLTGEGIDPESEDLPAYKKENLKGYPFTMDKAAAAGNPAGEDWYFARGTVATPIGVLDSYKQVGEKIAYDGQAVMFGLDYRPTKPRKPVDGLGDQSTNSVKPADLGSTFGKILLDGKQNFVRMLWDPASGEINGRVYGVWTLATYWREPGLNGQEKVWLYGTVASAGDPVKVQSKGDITFTEVAHAKSFTSKSKKEGYKFENVPVAGTNSGVQLQEIKTAEDAEGIAGSAYSLEPHAVTLVELKGKVTEGTNSFGGVATRCRDMSKGLFTGGFFGPKGHEIGGVINSQTGNMKDENLVDPAAKWGGSFGAKYNGKAVDEDLIFIERDVNYNTSTEFFN